MGAYRCIYWIKNSSYTEKMMPVIQIASAFPANFLFPFVVIFISHYNLNPNIALSFLMILGTQWYILFNVIAGTSAFPADLKESANIFRVKGWLWWKNIILPGIFPHIVTGVITAYGGAWNASIVAEIVSWGNVRISATGLGLYITNAANASDYSLVAIGVVVMSLYVIVISRLVWRPLYNLSVSKSKLS